LSRVLVLGSGGMAGHLVCRYLQEAGHSVTPVGHDTGDSEVHVDAEDEDAMCRLLAERLPDVIVNCIGVLVKDSERSPLRAIRLNALLPRILERESRVLGTMTIHVSTDCVFSGARGPYAEDDVPDGDDTYGKSKALGELNNDRDLTIRTSIIGPELKVNGTGLFHWFMRQDGLIDGYRQVFWGGVTTLELARFVDTCIRRPLAGLVHLTNGVPISKYELLALMKNIWGKNSVIIRGADVPVSNKGLRCTRTDIGHRVPPFRTMLEELHAFMAAHPDLYRQYA
jgi:dTDP-4-dehydrorhamnose reductase